MDVSNRISISLNKIRKAAKRSRKKRNWIRPSRNILKDILCEGWLSKTGGKGHTVKNQKKRWFVLRGVFLSYYSSNPNQSQYKRREILKGQLYLSGCKVSDVQEAEGRKYLVFTSRSRKEYLLSTTQSSTTSIEEWHRLLVFAIDRVSSSFLAENFEGSYLWKFKEGRSWHKRWFILRGNLLCYFSSPPKNEERIEGLKGSLDLSDITDLYILSDDDVSKQKPHSFMIITETDRYQIAGMDEDHMNQWFDLIVKQIRKIEAERDLDQRSISSIRKTIDHTRTRSNTKSALNNKQSLKERSIAITRVFRVLLALQTKEYEIWDGESFILPVLLHFSRILIQSASPNELCLIDVSLPRSLEFQGVLNKIYSVHPFSTIETIKERICQSFSGTLAQDYALVTLRNNILKPNAPIAAYGIGCILKIWQLKLVRIQELENHPSVTSVPVVKEELYPFINDMFPVLLLLSDSAFGSIPCLRIFLNCDLTTDHVVQSICEQYNVPDHRLFSFATIDGKRLPPGYTFRSLGLGTRFRDWELVLAHNDHFEQDKHELIVPGQKFLWTSFDELLTLDEAKEIISKLDLELADKLSVAKESIATLRDQMNNLNMKIQELETENEIIKMNLEQKTDEITEMTRADCFDKPRSIVNELEILEDTEMTYRPDLAQLAIEPPSIPRVAENKVEISVYGDDIWSKEDTNLIDKHFDPMNRSLHDYYTENASDIFKFMEIIEEEHKAYASGLENPDLGLDKEEHGMTPNETNDGNVDTLSSPRDDVDGFNLGNSNDDDGFSSQLLSKIADLENQYNASKLDKNNEDIEFAVDSGIDLNVVDLNFGIPQDQLFNSIEEMLAYEEEQMKIQASLNQLKPENCPSQLSNTSNSQPQIVPSSDIPHDDTEGFVDIDELIKESGILIKGEDNTFSREVLNKSPETPHMETPDTTTTSIPDKPISPRKITPKEIKVAQRKLSRLPTLLSKQKNFCDLQKSLESRSLSFKESDIVNIAITNDLHSVEWKLEEESIKDLDVLKIF